MNDSVNNRNQGDDSQPSRSERTRINPRRRARKPLNIDNSVPSPCLSVCRFDGEPFCVGCYRNIDEIREWMIMSREQKLGVLEKLKQRRRNAGNQDDST